MRARGISPDAIKMIEGKLSAWLANIKNPEINVIQVVARIRANPLIPAEIPIHGLIFDPHGGKIRVIVDGYQPIP